ncbi:MAG: S1 RNA-binding domain-containing protein [Anaerolineaceae bacterium]|nr:S1 RNA-binding domain-containing protein [Anaerolineaceae bacterium]
MQMDDTLSNEMDFAALLEASFAETALERGDLVTGNILAVDNQGLIVDVGVGRDGIVSRHDIERLNKDTADYQVGEQIDVVILRVEDMDGNLVLSVSQAQQSEDWKHAEELMNSEEVWEGQVIDVNRGGVIVPFGNLRGFIPASHVADLPRGMNDDDRKTFMSGLMGKTVMVKVIEVNRKRRRLVFSQREAQREHREVQKEALLEALSEGDIRTGTVSGLRDFGAFVDLGGADGLIHISELAWHRVKHPREVVNVGDKVNVYILRLDSEGKRIGLSLKRTQPNPWTQVEDAYHVGQLVEGVVSRVAQFGAFVSLEPGIEALLHISQISDPSPADAAEVIYEGQTLLMRIISIEADKQRLGLSLKEVTAEENERWLARRAEAGLPAEASEEDAEVDGSQDEADSVQLEGIMNEA